MSADQPADLPADLPADVPADCDVVVVGAGLAGLTCARSLQAAGLDVRVLEASPEVGGRVRTEEVDGHLVDVGFQLLNPSYPAVRRHIDVDALRLAPFAAGVHARLDSGPVVLGDPRRAPRLLRGTAAAGLPRLREALPLLRWAAPALAPSRDLPGRVRRRRPDRSLQEALDASGVRGDLRRVLEAFVAGVVLDDTGLTAEQMVLLVIRSFLAGTPSLPADGMRALPRQLAAPLGDRVRTSTPVHDVGPGRVRTGEGTVRARTVVLAAGPGAAAGLLDRPAPAVRGVVTQWWSAPADTIAHAAGGGLLRVDARSRPTGPLVNTSVVTGAAASCAPEGRHLVAASALMRPDAPAPTRDEMLRHAGELLESPTGSWEEVARHEVAEALPAATAPLDVRAPQRVADGLLVCGDHRDTPSIQGAMVSGERAAAAVLAGLTGPRRAGS